MPAGAALGPIIAAGIGAGGSIASSAIASGTHTTPAPPPVALFPGAQANYLQQLGVTGSSGLGPNSLSTLNEIGTTGTLAAAGNSAAPQWAALVAAQQRANQQGQANIAEQFAGSGLAYSSSLMNQLVNYNSQVSANQGALFAQLQQQGTANALNAANTGASLFQQIGTAMTPSAYVTTGGTPASTALGGASNLLQTMAMMQILFPSSTTTTTNTTSPPPPPTSVETSTPTSSSLASPSWLQLVNPTNYGPAANA